MQEQLIFPVSPSWFTVCLVELDMGHPAILKILRSDMEGNVTGLYLAFHVSFLYSESPCFSSLGFY